MRFTQELIDELKKAFGDNWIDAMRTLNRFYFDNGGVPYSQLKAAKNAS